MGSLPNLPYGDRIKKHTTVKFGGYDHNKSAQDGAIYDMKNMTSDDYPLLSSRNRRYKVREYNSPTSIFAHDGLYVVDGNKLILYGENGDRVLYSSLSSGEKAIAALGPYVIVVPDKIYYNKNDGTTGSLEASFAGTASITDGTYAGEAAELNTIQFSSGNVSALFKAGDGVSITIAGGSEMSLIIREIDGNKLAFYEHTFDEAKTNVSVTVKRSMPDMDFICTNENRLWGCKGDTIYSSKLGDPFNWNVFDGISTDSYAVDVGSAGDFTACFSYLGYPCFFKEDHIYKVYGSRPANYQVMGSASMGVQKGCHKSLAIAGEVLFYLSRSGVVAYSGGIPQNISSAFGSVRYVDGVGGSDGIKYYTFLTDTTGESAVFVYDTRVNLWHKEDKTPWHGSAWDGGMYVLKEDGLWLYSNEPSVGEIEDPIESFIEFGDFVEGDPNKKGTAKLQVRAELDAGASLNIEIMYDSDGVWTPVSTLLTPKKRSYYLPIIPHRCDHFRLRFTGYGKWTLYSLVRESYSGSEL